MSTPARAIDLTLPVSPPLTSTAAFLAFWWSWISAMRQKTSLLELVGVLGGFGLQRKEGWYFGCWSRLGRIGVGGEGRKLGDMRVGREEVVGKVGKKKTMADTDWSDIPAFNTTDISSVQD
ncbi:hypothetical protein BJ165DRAFT_1515375 [Panaeolus papilionaceus]|nr:hypothetical protein BJ165DRAFT_1515375 [Panaeolus papilionaceus]